VVEHGAGKVAPSTLNTVTAAKALGAPITALVAGQDVAAAAQQAARIEGVSKASAAVSSGRLAAGQRRGSPSAPCESGQLFTPGCGGAAPQVLVADDASLARPLAEPLAELLAAVQARRSFSHILAPSSTFGKNLLPRWVWVWR
jgi:electron transfer flavoprotein alpha subunit